MVIVGGFVECELGSQPEVVTWSYIVRRSRFNPPKIHFPPEFCFPIPNLANVTAVGDVIAAKSVGFELLPVEPHDALNY